MEQAWKEVMRSDIALFAEKIKAFEAGEVDKKAYKGFSGGFGSYAQREGGNMLRLRMAGGRLTKERLAFIADSVETYQIDRMKLTTCQTIQFHNLNADATIQLMEKALDVGIVTRGGGGDFPRNAMASPLSGVEKDEYFDVLPWAEGAAEYMLTLVRDIHMPRKLKVAFSNSPKNVTHATFRDLGFVARKDGTFDVYCAGGLGPNPRIGVKVAEEIEPESIIACIDAMIAVFTQHGNYENRAKARTRYLQESLGVEGLKAEYAKALAQCLNTSKKLSVQSASVDKTSDEQISGERIIPQKQKGLYAVCYHPIGGNLPVKKPRQLYETIKDMPQVECRISPDGTIYIINLTAAEAKEVLEVTKDSAVTPIQYSVSCIGASVCQQGVRDSQALLAAILQAVEQAELPANALPPVYISGCPSSCGTQQIGTLGFQGGVKKAGDKFQPAFTLLLKGNEQQGVEKLGEAAGSILQERIPEFMVKLGRMVAESGLDFYTWFEQNEQKFNELAKKYIAEE